MYLRRTLSPCCPRGLRHLCQRPRRSRSTRTHRIRIVCLVRAAAAADIQAAVFETFELPAVVLDGTTYLYDFDGRSMGIEHLLFTEEGEPVAVWNPENGEVEEVEIVDEGQED